MWYESCLVLLHICFRFRLDSRVLIQSDCTQDQSFTMIRSNPTAIPLRASDLKHLQETIEQRQKSADAASNPLAADVTHTASANQAEGGHSSKSSQPQSAVEQRKKDRAAMSVNERIGL